MSAEERAQPARMRQILTVFTASEHHDLIAKPGGVGIGT
jgi:hypothetical protein